MKKDSFFSRFKYWIKNSEIFTNPSKLLPGKWEIFEYYTELEDELIHKKEKQIKDEQLFAYINFMENGKFMIDTNLPKNMVAFDGAYSWSIAKNYVTLIHENDFRNNEEFQFAIVKETLKLLKKDRFGKIVIFGFFRRISQ